MRHFNVVRDDRICIYCLIQKDALVLEDEYHAFFICDKFADTRLKYLYSWYNATPSIENLSSLLNTENHAVIRKTAVFISKLLEHISQ